jgi:hypothetical protein
MDKFPQPCQEIISKKIYANGRPNADQDANLMISLHRQDQGVIALDRFRFNIGPPAIRRPPTGALPIPAALFSDISRPGMTELCPGGVRSPPPYSLLKTPKLNAPC